LLCGRSVTLSYICAHACLCLWQIRRIVEGEDMPRTGERQTLLFSATFPKARRTSR